MGMRKLSEKFIVTRQTMRRRELMNCQFLSNLLMYKATGIIIKMKPTFLYEHTFENNPGFRKLKNET